MDIGKSKVFISKETADKGTLLKFKFRMIIE
jgi:hypothetical protein